MSKLPDIPPMQCFSLVRAAKLLDLEIDDLTHLMEIGVIYPMTRFESYTQGILLVNKFLLNEALDSHHYCSFLPDSGIGIVSCLMLENSFDGLAATELRSLYLHKLYPYEDEILRPITAHISGYWLASKFYINFQAGFARSISIESVESIALEESEYSFKKCSFDVDVELSEVPFHNIFISRENVLKIREAILKGEVLDSSYILERGFMKKYSPTHSGSEKQTYKQAAMIKGLLTLLPNIDKELLQFPHKLHTKLDEMFRDAGIPYPVSDGKTLKEWLDKAVR